MKSIQSFDLKQFDQIRKLFHHKKLILSVIQPNQRSFSNPDLHESIKSEQVHSFRTLLFSNHQNDSNDITNNTHDCDNLVKPTPIPRRKKQQQKQQITRNNSSSFSILTSASSNTADSKDGDYDEDDYAATESEVPESEVPESNTIIDNNCNFISAPTLISTSKSLSSDKVFDVKSNLIQKSIEQFSRIPLEMSTIKTPIKIKSSKHSFRSFLKMNKIKTNKFLSLRSKINNGRKSLFESGVAGGPEVYKPRRPTRCPPPPPILIFRPAAPLPEDDNEEEEEETGYYDLNEQGQTKTPKTTKQHYASSIDSSDACSELYHDAANLYEIDESIYCSVDDQEMDKNNDKSETITKSTNSISDFYYDDGLCIYEELSSNDDGTIYEEYDDDEHDYDNSAIYDNASQITNGHQWSNQEQDQHQEDSKEQQEEEELSKKELKQLKQMENIMKKYKLNGDEIPVNAGLVKQDSKSDLFVRKGETVLILRMENNPPGKWLAKNERSKIGYIDLDNVQLETDSIKAAYQSFNSI